MPYMSSPTESHVMCWHLKMHLGQTLSLAPGSDTCACCALSGMTLMQTAELQHHSRLNFTS